MPPSRLRRERASEVRVNKARKRKELEELVEDVDEDEVPEQRPKKKARANLKQREGFMERVVSVFTDVIGDFQKAALESTMEANTMLRFNNRKPKPRQLRRFLDNNEIPSDEEVEVVEEGARGAVLVVEGAVH